MGKEQCAYYKEGEHWKTVCPRLKCKENNKRQERASYKVERNALMNEEAQGMPWTWDI